MELIKKEIYLSGLTGTTLVIPITLSQTIEDIGIYTDYVQLVTKDVEQVLNGENLTQTQLDYIINNSQNAQNYVIPKANNYIVNFPTVQLSSATNLFTVEWWNSIGRNELNPNAIRKEVLVSLNSFFESTKIGVISTATTIDDILGHQYSAVTANWEINKDGYLNYFTFPYSLITGQTINRLNEVRTFDETQPFVVGINGVLQIDSSFTAYTIGSINYITFSGTALTTNFAFISSGFNETNMLLDFIVKEEHLTGIVEEPKIEDNVAVDRQNTSVLDSFMRIQQLSNVEGISRYGNGYFNVSDQSISVKDSV